MKKSLFVLPVLPMLNGGLSAKDKEREMIGRSERLFL